jgi:hypothetical protein
VGRIRLAEDPIKNGEFLNQLSDYQLVTYDPAPRCQLEKLLLIGVVGSNPLRWLQCTSRFSVFCCVL